MECMMSLERIHVILLTIKLQRSKETADTRVMDLGRDCAPYMLVPKQLHHAETNAVEVMWALEVASRSNRCQALSGSSN